MFRHLSSVGGWMVLVLLALLSSSVEPIAFLSKKKTYTPLLFFTVPKGNMDEFCLWFACPQTNKSMVSYPAIIAKHQLKLCDSMEKVIKSLEKEQGVQVERLDIMRDRAARKLYEKLTEGNTRSPFPLLYHRESLQRVYGLADEDLVRSWSKGRLLLDLNANEKEITVFGGEDGAPPEQSEEDIDMEDLEMELDAELTPMQRRGKEAMKRRMQEGRKK